VQYWTLIRTAMKVGFCRLRLAALLVSVSAVTGTAAGEEGVDSQACFDAAVLARLVRTEDHGLISSPDSILASSSFGLQFEPVTVLYSRKPFPPGRFTLTVGAHSALRGEIHYMLVFLRDTGEGFSYRWLDVTVIRDEKGRFVRPLREDREPLASSQIFPRFWIPRDYAVRQEAVRYLSKDAWFDEEYDDDGNLLPRSKWLEKRALVPQNLTYVISRLADQPCDED
jgi:hypothetical protein